MARLNEQQKLFVVQRLACFYTPSEVRAELKLTFKLEVSLQAIGFYDPTTAEGARLSAALKQLFRETRERFLKEVTAIPIANQSYRLRKLQRIVERAGDQSPKTVMAALEQAAKEMGGLFTNQRDITTGGQPFKLYTGFNPLDDGGDEVDAGS